MKIVKCVMFLCILASLLSCSDSSENDASTDSESTTGAPGDTGSGTESELDTADMTDSGTTTAAAQETDSASEVAADSDTDAGTDSGQGDTETEIAVAFDFTDSDSVARGADDDVCAFAEAVTSGEPDTDGMVHVPANHPGINYFGRVDCSDPLAPSFAHVGVSIRAQFSGTALDMILSDHGSSQKPNFYNVVIDDGEPVALQVSSGENTYELARGLAAGVHTVEVFKRTESSYGDGEAEFLGFRIDAGAELSAIAPRPGRIEFIGDSITCGYGNEISVDDPDNYSWTTKNSNAWNAWSAITARALDAELMVVAYSGRGVFRNYSDQSGKTLPEMYLDTHPDGGADGNWRVGLFNPDVLVINLGTNDFSPGVEREALEELRADYEETMAAFVAALREVYPETAIILAVGPMLDNGYPQYYQALTSVRTALQHIVQARNDDGDSNVYMLNIPKQEGPWGEDWHPTVATHQGMADLLVALIQEKGLM